MYLWLVVAAVAVVVAIEVEGVVLHLQVGVGSHHHVIVRNCSRAAAVLAAVLSVIAVADVLIHLSSVLASGSMGCHL